MYGDVPIVKQHTTNYNKCSPIVRGCSLCKTRPDFFLYVFPTDMGMFLRLTVCILSLVCVPHRHGDIPVSFKYRP